MRARELLQTKESSSHGPKVRGDREQGAWCGQHQIVEGLYFGFGLGPVGLGPVGLGPVGLAVGPVAGLGGSAVAVGSAAVGSPVAVGAAVGSAVAVGCAGAVGCGATAGPVLVLRAVVVGRALVPGLLALLESGFARIDSIRAMMAMPATTPTTIRMLSLAHGESPRRGAGGSFSYTRSLSGGLGSGAAFATTGATPIGSTVGTLTGSVEAGAGEGNGSEGTTKLANGSDAGAAASLGGGGGGGGGTERWG